MISYLIKSTLCSALLLFVYLLFLEREKMHRFNRLYLLFSVVFSLIVPFIPITFQPASAPVVFDSYFTIANPASSINTISADSINNNSSPLPILPIIYCLVCLALLVRFVRNIYLIRTGLSKNKIIEYKGAKLILLKEDIISHTFLNNIFISESTYNNRDLEEEILTHELAHVRQKHSLDILFIELIQTIFWFNPFLLLYKKAIRLNHEFLADNAVIKTYQNIAAYQHLLLAKINGNSNPTFASSFNYLVTKKRLYMMTTKTSAAKAFLKGIALVPVFLVTIFIFSNKIVAQQQKPATLMNLKAVPSTKDGASKELLDEMAAILEKNKVSNKVPNAAHLAFSYKRISDEETNRLEFIYKQMSKEQQAASPIIFIPPISPLPNCTPTDAQFESWKNGDMYKVWVNGWKIKNEDLNKHEPSDFGEYQVYVVPGYGKKNGKYIHEVSLMTKEYYAAYYKRTVADHKYHLAFRFKRDPKNS